MTDTTSNNDSLHLDLISVVIVAASNNPIILNPDFLLHNGIVSRDQEVEENPPPISTPAFSQVAFKGGLKVTADPTRILFEQVAGPLSQPLTEESVLLCIDTAKGYIRTLSHVPYNAIGINPRCYRVREERETPTVSRALIDEGLWMRFEDCPPNFQLKATYQYDDRTITLDIKEEPRFQVSDQENLFGRMVSGDLDIPTFVFEGNIHRDIKETNQQMRILILLSVLNSWNKDLSDFYSLVRKFNNKIGDS